jgi:hypothetical protein
MDRNTIITAAFSDTHREDLQATYGSRFMLEAESMIRSRLEFYYQESVLECDVIRVAPNSAVYTLPQRDISLVRHVLRSDGWPLDQTDETNIAAYASLSTVVAYVVRPTTIMYCRQPRHGRYANAALLRNAAALVADGDSNNLLNDYPDLYKEAIQVSIWKRARDYDAATAMFQSANSKLDEINRKMKKLIRWRGSSNPYNTELAEPLLTWD